MTDTVESGSRSRTRRAILDAAVVVFSQRRTASLGDVAAEANVARSTLHRYFADRAELVHALAQDVLVAVEKAIAEAALDQGTPREALHRLAAQYFELGPRMFFLFNEPSFNAPEPDERVKQFFGRLDEIGKPIEELILRGQRDGVFAASLPVDWIIRMFWWLIYIGWEAVDEGALPRLSAPATILQTIEHGISTPPATP